MKEYQKDFAKHVSLANKYVSKTYLHDLSSLTVVPISEYNKKFQAIRLYKINKLVYDKNEDINDKLISVFNAVQNTRSNIVLIICGKKTEVEFYVGVQSSREIGVADKVFHKSFLGNFPGSSAQKVPQEQLSGILTTATTFEDGVENLTILNVVPALRRNNEETFVQGIENFVDAMKGEEYTCFIIGSSVSDDECEERLKGYEQMYSTLYPLSGLSLSHATSIGKTMTEGFSKSVSKSISNSISKTTGTNVSDTSTNGRNIGAGFLGVSFGAFNSSSHTVGSSESTTSSDSTSTSESKSTNNSTSTSENITDNMTVNYKDKTVENLLKDIEKKIERIKECTTYGMWECAAYFMAGDVQTSVVAANAFRTLMIGEDNKNEKSFLNLFGMRERESTERALESVRYCRHPMFELNADEEEQTITATEYISGKELPLLFSLPRKSVPGVMVASMAEFARNIVFSDERQAAPEKIVNLGKITHMNRVEDTEVKLNLESFASHCFITGSTGSGKSNTTFTLINELIRPENDIPFLVVEPAKGEYKFAFAKVPNINIFTTTNTSGRFLKINPFRFNTNIHVLEHIDRLIEIFNTCWEMYAAMPAILKETIEKIYEKKGWDLLNSAYLSSGAPQFPTLKDLLVELPNIINSSGYSSDTKGDYIGALVTRVNSLTNGIIGQIFCDCYDVEDEVLFDQKTIVDLSRVGSSETKSLIMGILVLKLTEHRMANVRANNSKLRHITILEEAHNLLKNVKGSGSAGNTFVAKSVEMISNSIAEMRTYGEGFVIVDQSPSAVDVAAIKNTNTKIIMRLPEMNDCEIVGKSVSLNDNQILENSKLRTGVAIVMQNDWSDAVLTQVNRYEYPYEGDINSYSWEQILKFKGFVMCSLLDECLLSKTKSIAKVLEKIESFDIDYYKKADAKCMVESIMNTLDKKWSSLYLGKSIIQFFGLENVFRRAESEIKNLPHKNKQGENPESQFDMAEMTRFLNRELDRLFIEKVEYKYKDKIIQYSLYAKMFEEGSIDYEKIYKSKYIR